jgi:predicted dehydrogenase
VARPDVDIVDVATPGDSHAEIAIAAAEAGKAVLCEKPLANDVRDAKVMLKAVRKAGVPHMVCHNYRRIPAVMLARDLASSGKLGRIFHYRGTYLQDWPVDPALPLYWRFRKEKAGSGSLGDILSHSLDLGRFVLGSEVTEVAGALETFVKRRPLPEDPKRKGRVTVDDAALSLVRFANGAVGSIEGTRFATGRKNYNRFEINGSKGSVAFDLERMNELETAARLARQYLATLNTRPVGARASRYPSVRSMLVSATLALGMLLALGATRHIALAVPLLFFTGYWGIMLMASCNTSIQLQAPDALRGRVMSIYTWVSGGVFPIGAFIVGTISQWWGVSAAFVWNGTLGLAAVGALMLWWRLRHDSGR